MRTPEELAWVWYWGNLSDKPYAAMLTNPPKYAGNPVHAFLAGYQAAAPQWISVKDRLPEIGVDVLISYGGLPFYHLAFLTHNGDIQWFNGNHSNTEYSLDEVTHWMPLPAAPKEEV